MTIKDLNHIWNACVCFSVFRLGLMTQKVSPSLVEMAAFRALRRANEDGLCLLVDHIIMQGDATTQLRFANCTPVTFEFDLVFPADLSALMYDRFKAYLVDLKPATDSPLPRPLLILADTHGIVHSFNYSTLTIKFSVSFSHEPAIRRTCIQ